LHKPVSIKKTLKRNKIKKHRKKRKKQGQWKELQEGTIESGRASKMYNTYYSKVKLWD